LKLNREKKGVASNFETDITLIFEFLLEKVLELEFNQYSNLVCKNDKKGLATMLETGILFD
jgi:hypothetical protein